MRIITANLNGIRSATEKGFFDWFARQKADVLCLQETKAQRHQLVDKAFFPKGWHAHFHDAEAKGYSGVAVYSKREPDAVVDKLGWAPFDAEGRYLEARFGDLSVVSLYLPSGSSSEERQAFKYQVMDWLLPKMREWRASGRRWVLCGDWNIGGCAPRAQAGRGRIHLVVEPRQRLGQRRRLADRLPRGHARSCAGAARCQGLPREEVLRPRPADHRLRPLSARRGRRVGAQRRHAAACSRA